jgi:hypothetical protein
MTGGHGPLLWMVGTSVAAWAVIAAAGGARVNPEALFGMLGPLVSAGATWIAVRWAQRSAAANLMGVMIAGFALKMVFFGAYVAAMLRFLALRPVPFVVSFTGYFIALYAMEALFLRRAFAPPR